LAAVVVSDHTGLRRRTVRDLEVIDSELLLLLAIRRVVREEEGRARSISRIDELLDDASVLGTGGTARGVRRRVAHRETHRTTTST
jgi:hypothetical protein